MPQDSYDRVLKGKKVDDCGRSWHIWELYIYIYVAIYADAPEFWAKICLYLVFVCLFHERKRATAPKREAEPKRITFSMAVAGNAALIG